MKLIISLVLASAFTLTGCATQQNGEQLASATEESYVPLGTSIPKKGKRSAEDKTLDLQQMENNRIMNNGTSNTP